MLQSHVVSHPSLVLLPGMDGTGMLFEPLLDALPADVSARVVRYPTDASLSYEALVTRVLAQLADDEPFVLVAESFSGPIALRVAATRPAGLRAIVLCASFAISPVPVPAALAKVARPRLLRAAPFSLQAPIMLGAGADAPLRGLLRSALEAVSPNVLAFRIGEVLRVDVTDALAACPVPLLYLRATRDRLVSARSRDHVVAHQPRASVVDIDGPHLLLQRRPAECWRAMVAFLDDRLDAQPS